MRKILFVIMILFLCISVYPAEIPLIFLHGHKKQAKPWEEENEVNAGGWGTWNPQNADYSREHPSSMTDILDEHYGGYIAGNPLNCSKDSTLSSTNGNTKVMYNYSFYREDASPGVIGLSEDTMKVYFDAIGNRYFPYMEEYPPLNYVTYQWWPKYIPLSSSSDYVNNWKNGRFAKEFASFIDKVLIATGASQVDIVTHSMGALVARSAIKNYGCSSKVRKLLTVGAPNRPYGSWWEAFYSLFGPDKPWQKSGEDLEMGVNVPLGTYAKFLNIQTGDEDYWCNYLDYNNYIEAISTIMGDRGSVLWGEPNDNAVAVFQSYINSAQFNAVVYEQHSYDNDIPELCETSSSFTTEFIKKWMIDDEVKTTDIGTNFAYDARGTGNPYYWAKGCLRIRSAALNYENSLITLVRLQKKVGKKDKGDTTKTIYDVYTKAFQIYKYSRSFPGDPVFLVNKLKGELFSEYWLTIWDMDMTGEIKYSRETIHLQDGDSAYVTLSHIDGFYIGKNVTWTTNDYAVFQKLYYRRVGHGWSFLDSLNGDLRNYVFTPPSTGDYQVMIKFYLDAYTPISGVSNEFNVYPQPPPVLQLDGYVDSFSTKATEGTEGHFAHLNWVFNNPEHTDSIADSFVMYKDNNKVNPFFPEPNNWKDPVKYTYVGESHTYRLDVYVRWIPPYVGSEYFSSDSLTLTADTAIPPDTGCPYFYIKENGEYIPQNTIMNYGYNNKEDNYLFDLGNRYKNESRDNDIVNKKYKNEKSVIEAAISENEVEKDYIDRINLKAVKYDSTYNLTLNQKGEYIFWKDIYKIDSCKNAKGEDILSLVENMGDSFYMAFPGDTIYIYTGTRYCDNANANRRSNRGGGIITGAGNKADPVDKCKDIEPSIEIEYTGGKSWVNGGEIYPREYIYASYSDIPLLSDSIRFVINNEVKIDYISFPISENVKYNEIKLELINPTLKGKNVMKQIIKEDSVYINLITGDTLYFSFPLITPANGEKVSYILETDGYYNIENKRDKSESATVSKSNIKFISGIVYLQSKHKMYSNYEIYNISGRQVGQGEIKTGKIKIQKLCNGIYFIKLKGKHRSETHKFEVIR